MVGRYDGVMSVPEMLRLGDFGVGTLDHLDGELIVLDGTAYQVNGDGDVKKVGSDRSTPFVVLTHFETDGEFLCWPVGSLNDLEARLDKALTQRNNFIAIRIDGQFESITVRSVNRQEPPYRALSEVAKSQSVRTYQDISGTLVGVRCPSWVGTLNVPGYHWHFLSDDRKRGGHVLDCKLKDGRVRFDVCHEWVVKLDSSAEFNSADLGQDLRADLHRVESSRGAADTEGGSGASKRTKR
jgi:acetolactate decarboxylase